MPNSAVMTPEGEPSTKYSFKVRPRREIEREGDSDIYAELSQINVHFLPRLSKLHFEVTDFVLYCLKIDLRLGLERIYIARNVQIKAVGFDILERRVAGIAVDLGAVAIDFDNLSHILVGEPILLLARLKVATSIDKQNVTLMRP